MKDPVRTKGNDLGYSIDSVGNTQPKKCESFNVSCTVPNDQSGNLGQFHLYAVVGIVPVANPDSTPVAVNTIPPTVTGPLNTIPPTPADDGRDGYQIQFVGVKLNHVGQCALQLVQHTGEQTRRVRVVELIELLDSKATC